MVLTPEYWLVVQGHFQCQDDSLNGRVAGLKAAAENMLPTQTQTPIERGDHLVAGDLGFVS